MDERQRAYPEAPCTLAFSTVAWQVLYRHQKKTLTVPAEPPSLHETARWLAQLGGFMGRKGDGEPGVKVLWRGLTRLQDIVTGFLLTSLHVGNA
ncbi:MAG: IS4 family transposase [Armatimonadota bacterium]